jgi:hypothetical protein
MDRDDTSKDWRIAQIKGIMAKQAPKAPKQVKGRRSTFVAARAPQPAPKTEKGRRSTWKPMDK